MALRVSKPRSGNALKVEYGIISVGATQDQARGRDSRRVAGRNHIWYNHTLYFVWYNHTLYFASGPVMVHRYRIVEL